MAQRVSNGYYQRVASLIRSDLKSVGFKMFRHSIFCLALLFASTQSAVADTQLRDGDLVVFVGNTLIEREQEYGFWEALLTVESPAKSVWFRNLGWSGDTVWTESRGIFDPPKVGYQRLVELVKELKPTIIVLGYGTVESFRGEDGLSEFENQYQKLRSDLSAEGVRFLHLSPMLMEQSSFPVNSAQATEHVQKCNSNLEKYAEAIHKIAQKNQETFVDLQAVQRNKPTSEQWMQNGLHLNRLGYQRTAPTIREAFGLRSINPDDVANFEQIVESIRRKNELFFHRWRPQNITYLTGFRKHEQGQNAVEIAQFDPLVAELEEQISELKE